MRRESWISNRKKVRDKDAFSAIKGICSLALDLKAKQQTIKNYLEKIYKEFGYYEELNIEKTLRGLMEKFKEKH